VTDTGTAVLERRRQGLREARYQGAAREDLRGGVLLAQAQGRVAGAVAQHRDRHADLLAIRVLGDPLGELLLAQPLRDRRLGGRRQHQALHRERAAGHRVGPGDRAEELVERFAGRNLVLLDRGETGGLGLVLQAELGRERGFLGPQLRGVYEGEEASGLVPAEGGGVLVDLEYGPGERARCHGSVGHGHNPASFMAGIGNRVNGE